MSIQISFSVGRPSSEVLSFNHQTAYTDSRQSAAYCYPQANVDFFSRLQVAWERQQASRELAWERQQASQRDSMAAKPQRKTLF